MSAIILFGIFFLLISISVPIGHAIGIAAAVCLIFLTDLDISIFAQTSLNGLDSFSILSIPFFMLAGNLMARGGVARRIVDFADTCIGFVTGGLSVVTTVSCMFFGAISGSAVATTTAIGAAMIPEMEKAGYNKDFLAALAAAAGTIGVIIPPSTCFILYGVVTRTSIKDLFTAGILPGILMGIAIIIVCIYKSKKHGWRSDKDRPTLKSVWISFKKSFFALLMPVIILGGIYGGIFSPSEASVVSVVYCILVSVFIYKEFTAKTLYAAFREMVELNGYTMFMMSFATAFTYFLTIEQIPNTITDFFLGISDNGIVVLLLINLLLLIIGLVIDNIPATIIMAPILLPVVEAYGMDPITFGMVMTLNLAIGFITPPYGVNLFMAAAVSGVSMEKISRQVIPFIFALLVVLILLTYIPILTLVFV